MLVSAVWLAPAALATISAVAQRRLNGQPPAQVSELIWAGGDWLVYAILTPPIFYVSRRWPIVRPHILRRSLLHLLFAVFFCIGWAVSGKLLQLALALIFRPPELQEFLNNATNNLWSAVGLDVLGWIFVTLPFGVVVYLSITGIAHAIRYFVEAKDRELQLVRLSEQLASARLGALQAQLNPHFLFNSLNTVAVLSREGNSAAATRVVEQLSDVLRSTLDRSDANEVTVEDEMELVRQYLAVEQARFSDRLRPEFEIDPSTLGTAVPSFALQHLVENAIRHGISRRTEAGRLVIRSTRTADGFLELSVEDDGAGLVAATDRKGHGLDNTRERLKTLYGDQATLTVTPREPHGAIATLRLPFREILLEPRNGQR
jgi:sensor histidine kinase YesM